MYDGVNGANEMKNTIFRNNFKSQESRKKILIFLLLTLLIVAIIFAVQYFISLNKQIIVQPKNQAISQIQPQKIQEGGNIEITDSGFVPATIEITKGDSVTWTNLDKKSHQIASDPYPTNTLLPDLVSEPLFTNDSFTFTFDQVGTFTYHDNLNPLKLRGTVIVK